MTDTEPDSAPAGEPTLVTVEPTTTAVVRGAVPPDQLRDFFDRSFQVLGEVIASPASQRSPVRRSADIAGRSMRTRWTSKWASPRIGPSTPTGSAEAGSLPGGRVARLVHPGPFDQLSDAWHRLADWIDTAGLTPGPDRWEVYLTEPSPEMDPADLRTELDWAIS